MFFARRQRRPQLSATLYSFFLDTTRLRYIIRAFIHVIRCLLAFAPHFRSRSRSIRAHAA